MSFTHMYHNDKGFASRDRCMAQLLADWLLEGDLLIVLTQHHFKWVILNDPF